MILLVALVAGLVGLSLGLLGGGGSVLVVPLFTYALGYSAKQAIVMSLAVVGVTSLVGAFSHWRHGQIDSRLALIFGGAAMGSAYLGARLGTFLSGQAQLILFALVMLLAALFMARPRRDTSPLQYRFVDAEPRSPRALGLIIPAGLGVGMLTGLIGVGGGFLIVPTLVLLAKVPMKTAIGTSLLVIAMNSLTGFAGYLGQVDLPWDVLGFFITLAVGATLVGTTLGRFVSQDRLRQGFAVFLVGMATLMLYQNRGVLLVLG